MVYFKQMCIDILIEGYYEFKEEWARLITSSGTDTTKQLEELGVIELYHRIILTTLKRHSEKERNIVMVNIVLMKIAKDRQAYEKVMEYLRSQQLLWPLCVRLEEIG